MSTPPGYTTVAPWIMTDDTRELLRFIGRAFEGLELGQVPLEDGSIGHAEIRIGDTVVLAFDRREGWPHLLAMLRVFVEDVDPEEAVRRLSEPVYADAMREAQESFDRELRDGGTGACFTRESQDESSPLSSLIGPPFTR